MTYTVNPICTNCKRLGNGCEGTTRQTWTGCVYHEPARKMRELYTAYYSDRRTVYEKTLKEIYANRNGAGVEIRPTIWLWKSCNADVFFVDYVGDGLSCTLKCFDTLTEAQSYRNKIANLNEIQFEQCFLSREYETM